MAFQIPDGLSREVYPIAWLFGRWRGAGFVHYPGTPEQPVMVEVEFGSDGGPYLTYRSTTWRLNSSLESLQGPIDVDSLDAGEVFDSESGYWRVIAQTPDDVSSLTGAGAGESAGTEGAGGDAGSTASGHGGGDGAGSEQAGPTANAARSAGGTEAPTRELEVLLAQPSGHVSVYLGTVKGPRIELGTDVVARTEQAAEISAAARMYGLVGGELMWATDMAAYGNEMQSYSSGRLQRQDDPQ